MADRPTPQFSRKRIDEDRKLTFDFTNDLATGEAISTATVVATVFSGTDASPGNIISGSAAISGATITQLVVDGTDGVTYLLEFRAGTDQSQKLEGMALLEISDTESSG
jgi:hypothetical protein